MTMHLIKIRKQYKIKKSDSYYHSFLINQRIVMLHPNLNIHTSWQAEVMEVVDCLGRSIGDVNQALVDTHLECLTASLVYVRAFYYCVAAAPRW